MFETILTTILLLIGFLVVLKYSVTLLYGIYACFLRSGKSLSRYGKWAIVTGATDGIGKAMAWELARKKMNIILVSRTLEKLEECKSELLKKFPGVEVKVFAIDYMKFDATTRLKLSEFIASLDIGVLINNVGISYPYPKYFYELDDNRVEELMTLNVYSTTWMTKLVLNGMVQRKRGAIVNIGSGAGVSNSPLLAEYGAAKSYIDSFSRTLNVELRHLKIHVQCQVPLFVATKLAKIKHTSLFVPSPQDYARSAVASIGYESVISPYWSHAIQIWLLANLPEWMVAKITFDMHKGIRAAGMKKEARLASEVSGSKEKNS